MATVSFEDAAPASPGAVAYACSRLGLRVFPLVPGTKRPALKGWKTAATADLEQIREWFTGEYAAYGVGIATGPASGVWVMDIDMKHGINGFEALKRLAEQHGEDPNVFASTLVVATPSGGAHLYFRWGSEELRGKGIPTKSGCPVPGIDTRGMGGLVRAPGIGGYQVVPRDGVRRVGIAAAPAWLTRLCVNQARQPDTPVTGGVNVAGVMAPERAIERLEQAAPGTRNDELNRAAFRLALSGKVSEGEAWAECRLILVSIGANDSVETQRRTFLSGWEGGVRKRGSINAHDPYAAAPTAMKKE